ncbi:hypothetical protein FJ364_02005, partial [Candidatus Dependentiae bacterium]|nr:hypothetical protein [Candidatus Dependentiae bacterium]
MRKIGIIIFLLFCIVYLDLKAANRYAVNNDSLSNEEELVGHSIFLSFENFLNFEKLAVDVDLDDEADDGEK